MDIKFTDGNYDFPILGVYARDKETCLGILPYHINDLIITPRLNATSELSLTIPMKMFSATLGKTSKLPIASKLKKGVLIRSVSTDKYFRIPVAWDANDNVTRRSFLGVHWWVVTNTNKVIEGNKTLLTITAASYEHTLKERKVALSSGDSEKKQVVKISKPYVVSYSIPSKSSNTRVDSGGHTVNVYNYEDAEIRVGWYSPSGSPSVEDITYAINFNALTESALSVPEEAKVHRQTKQEIIRLFFGEYTNSQFQGGFFSSDFIGDRLYTESGYNVDEAMKAVQNGLYYLRWVSITNGETIVTSNASSYLNDDQNYGSPEVVNLYIAYDGWVTIEDLIETAQDIWTMGYVSPVLTEKFRTIPDAKEGIYSFLTGTICKMFECFCVFDTDNETINLFTQDDLFVNSSEVLLSYQNLITQSEINTSDRELITCCHVASKDDTDYSIGYVNPLGGIKIYNFGDYKQYLSDTLKNHLDAWDNRISAFEKLYARLGYLRLYYIQTYTYWYSRMSDALGSYLSIIDEINIGIANGDVSYPEQLSTDYKVGDILPLTTTIGQEIRANTLDLNIQSSELETIFPVQLLTESQTSEKTYKHLISRLNSTIKRYYIMRWNYIGTHNRFTAVNEMAKAIYNICKMQNTTSNTFINDIANEKVKRFAQNAASFVDDIYVFNSSFRTGAKDIQDFFNCFLTDDYTTMFNSDFFGLTSTKIYREHIPSVKNYTTSVTNTVINSASFPNPIFVNGGIDESETLKYYIIEGTYTDENTVFSDLGNDNNMTTRQISAKSIANELATLYRKAKKDMKILSKQDYEFSFTTVNMLMSSQLALKNGGGNIYADIIYIGATVNAEIEPNHWEKPVVLETILNYSNPTEVSFTCSNNYKLKPLAYRFEDLYNDLPSSSGLNVDYSSDFN